jgi:CRP/FNR family transcriptional regulator, cyclic AMP receptor protein
MHWMETPAPFEALLEGVPRPEVDRLLAESRIRRFARGEVVFHEGDAGDTLHLIAAGRFSIKVTTDRGEVAVLAILGPGEIFGEMALLRSDVRRSATITATEPGETRTITRERFRQLRRDHPRVADVLLAILADKVARYTGLYIEAQYVPAERRVVRRLIELAQIYGDGDVPVTQEELASLAGTSRATVNRVLRQEEERGTVVLRRGHTGVLDLESLSARAR